jgi:hypothetical protein
MSINTIKVRVNSQQGETVRAISYGSRELKSSSDLSFVGATDGDAIVYQANTNSFVVAPVDSKGISTVDGGLF